MSAPLWAIGAPDGKSDELMDNYKEPNNPGELVWRIGDEQGPHRWPLFHPSEADPEAGYRLHPYTILFDLEHEPAGAYLLRIDYLVIAPRLAFLELNVNGTPGRAYLRPAPSRSGEIRLLSGLHTTIYSDGTCEVVIPGALLRRGENRLELIARDGGQVIQVDRIEAIKRLDRMANGAGFLYQYIAFSHLDGPAHRVVVQPTVAYRRLPAGELVANCFLYIELGSALAGGVAELLLTEGNRLERVELNLPASAFGHLELPFDLFDGEGEVQWQLTGAELSAGGALVRRRKWKVFITPHSHTDIGYTHRQWEVAERLCRNIDTALDTMEQDQSDPPAFTYHLDAAWALEHFLATRSERRKEQFFRQMRAGRIGVAGIYADLLTQFAGLEDLIRNSTVVDTMLRPHGLTTDFASVVDVASISSSLPAILEGAGIKYLVHANNQDRGPFRLNGGLHKVLPFWWEGQAGGRVMVWLAKMYCELRKVCGSPPVLDSAARGLEMWLQEFETDAYAPDAVMLYGQEADNTDLDPQPVSFVQRWNETYAYPELIACDVSQFFRYVEEGFGDRLVSLKGDGGAYWEDGAGSSIAQSIQVRHAQAALPAAERLEALAVIHTPDWAFPAQQFDEAWRETLLYDEHTWGAFLSCREPDALLAHDQWAVKEGFARQSCAWSKRLLHGAAVRHSLNWNNDGREVVVYNPHSWTVSGPITVEIEPDEIPIDPDTGGPIPMRRLKRLATQALVELWVDELPGLSYRRFLLQRVSGEGGLDHVLREMDCSAPLTLENRYYRLTIDPARGLVTSWYDLELEQELVDGTDAWGLGQLLYAQGGEGTRLVSNQSDWPDGNPDVRGDFQVTGCQVRHYDHGVELVVSGLAPYGQLTVTWTLPDAAKWVDLQFAYTKEERLAKEAVYIAFPLALPGAAVRSDSQLGWVDWDKEQLPGGCKEWLPLQTGILVSGVGADVLICSPDIPLFTVGDVVQGRWPKEVDLTGGRVFSYVLNNYWHTNYKASQGGEIRFRYRLTSGSSISADQAYRMGWEARRGLYGHRMSFQDFRESRAPYAAPAGGRLALVGTEQVVLSTITKARWAEGFVLRLQEIAGLDQEAPVAIAGRRIARAWLTDLLEREVRELAVQPDGSLIVPVQAWGLATVRIVMEQ